MAACDYEPGATDFTVTRFGARKLWDETEAALPLVAALRLARLRAVRDHGGRLGLAAVAEQSGERHRLMPTRTMT